MLGFLGRAIGGIFSGIGNLFGHRKQVQAQRETNEWNAQLAREQMNFQERMSNTAYRRAVADMKAAGLNPILAAHSAASTPSGAMATMQNPESQSSEHYGSAARMAALEGRAMESNIAHTNATTSKVDNEKENLNADTILKSAGAATSAAQRQLYDDQAALTRANTAATIQRMLQDKEIFDLSKGYRRAESEFWTKGGSSAYGYHRLGPLGTAASVVGPDVSSALQRGYDFVKGLF